MSHYMCMREFRMVLCQRSRVSKMRLHKLYSLRNKSVTVLPARSTWLIPLFSQPYRLNKSTPEIKRLSGLLSSVAQGSGFII